MITKNHVSQNKKPYQKSRAQMVRKDSLSQTDYKNQAWAKMATKESLNQNGCKKRFEQTWLQKTTWAKRNTNEG